MTNLLEKIYNSENLYEDEFFKKPYEDIKLWISQLKEYTKAFVEYKFLYDLKKHLCNKEELTVFDKWKLLKLYEEYREEKRKKNPEEKQTKKVFFEDKISDFVLKTCKEKHNGYDCYIIENSFGKIAKYLSEQKKDYPRFSNIFDEEKLKETEKKIIMYFFYKKKLLKLINEDTFLEDYFDEEYFSDIVNGNLLRSYLKITGPATRLLGENGNAKNVSGYKDSFFKGKTEFNIKQLQKKIDDIDKDLKKELGDIFKSEWLKSIILDLLCSHQVYFDISSEIKNRLT